MFNALRLFLARWKLRLLADELRELDFAIELAELTHPPAGDRVLTNHDFIQYLRDDRRKLVREQVRTMARIKSLSSTQP